MNFLPYIIVLVLLGALMLFTQRNRRRQIAEEMVRASQIGVGTEVMTTSGLYGTVVARNADDTVLLSIAPGVEVKWALAALRDAASLSDRYRRPIAEPDQDGGHQGAGGAVGLTKNAQPKNNGKDGVGPDS